MITVKSPARQAFEHYLRTGRRVREARIELKFNPYHDPRNGQFTFAPGGPRSLVRVIVSDRRRTNAPAQQGTSAQTARGMESAPAVYQPDRSAARSLQAQYRPTRPGLGHNGGPPLNDPMTLDRVFPGLGTARTDPASATGDAILAMADNILDLTGPTTQLTAKLTAAHADLLISQIRTVDPNYRFESLGFPQTVAGQANLIRQLRADRAATLYRARNEVRPLQVEMLRFMQESADRAYDEGVAYYEAGHLSVKLSREEAIGNFVDRRVRRDLRKSLASLGVDYSKGERVRIIGREYDSSGSDLTYRIPDARVGEVAFDVTLARKTSATAQVRGFFAADFRPSTVVIVRPRQLGAGSTYAIARPKR